MPNQNQNLRQTLVVSQDGKRIILSRNDYFKTPEIVFNNVPIGAVYEFVKPIERSTSQAIFRKALVKSYDSYFAASLVVGGIRGEAIGGFGETPPPPFNFGLTETVKGVGNNYVTLGVPRFTTSDVYANLDHTEREADRIKRGFNTVDAQTAATIWHEIGHVYVVEFSLGAGGHGEAFSEVIYGKFDGVQTTDIFSYGDTLLYP